MLNSCPPSNCRFKVPAKWRETLKLQNFKNDSTVVLDSNTYANDPEVYFFIDDVSVVDCTVGINEIQNSSVYFSVSPNPVKNKLTLQLQNTKQKITAIEITNSLGQKVFEKSNANITNRFQTDVSFLQSGVYFVRAFGEDGMGVRKFVKE